MTAFIIVCDDADPLLYHPDHHVSVGAGHQASAVLMLAIMLVLVLAIIMLVLMLAIIMLVLVLAIIMQVLMLAIIMLVLMLTIIMLVLMLAIIILVLMLAIIMLVLMLAINLSIICFQPDPVLSPFSRCTLKYNIIKVSVFVATTKMYLSTLKCSKARCSSSD